MSNEPIDPPLVAREDAQPFRAEVIDLDGIRIRWGRPIPGARKCEHKHMVYCQDERRVWCENCKRTIDNFDALMVVVYHLENMQREANAKLRAAEEAARHAARLRAVKALDRAWSGNVAAVGCPHCGGGLLPEDFVNGGFSSTSREIEIARRRAARRAPSPPPPSAVD